MSRIEPKLLTDFYAYTNKRTEIPTTGFSVLFYSTQIWQSYSISLHNSNILYLFMIPFEQIFFLITYYWDTYEHDLPGCRSPPSLFAFINRQ